MTEVDAATLTDAEIVELAARRGPLYETTG
jgi:hypothetical protein